MLHSTWPSTHSATRRSSTRGRRTPRRGPPPSATTRSRAARLVTNQAIVDAIRVARRAPCSTSAAAKGGSCARLRGHGIQAIGVDVVSGPHRPRDARRRRRFSRRVIRGHRRRRARSRASTSPSRISRSSATNPSTTWLHMSRACSRRGGALIIQTLHPVVAVGDLPYVDGWRQGSWAGFSEDFSDPAPWYFRTTESWVRLLRKSGLRLDRTARAIASNIRQARVRHLCRRGDWTSPRRARYAERTLTETAG